jgi:hypothetical protein
MLCSSSYISTSIVYAEQCNTQIYEGRVTVKVYYKGSNSYLDVEVHGVPAGLYPPNGGYNGRGWCLNASTQIDPDVVYGNSYMYSSLMASHGSSEVPSCMRDHEDWNRTNYILDKWYDAAYPDYVSWKEIQQALWRINDDAYHTNDWTPPMGNPAIVREIVEDALANGGNFQPGQGDWMAIIIDAHNTEEIPPRYCENQLIGLAVQRPFCNKVPELPLGTMTALIAPLIALFATSNRKKIT